MPRSLDALLDEYKSCLFDLFGDDLVGIYLTGSAVLGDFREGKSDADCTAILKSPPDSCKIAALQNMHRDLAARYGKIPLESQYIPCDNIGKSEADTRPFYSYHDRELSLGKLGANEVTWYTLKKYGVTVAGVPASDLNISASICDVKSYVKNNVNTYWKYLLDTARGPASPQRKLALTNWAVEWCVCGLTRMYYTMMEDDITSKGKAAEYGLVCLPECTRKILKEALRIRAGVRSGLYDSRYTRRKDMVDYMDYLIDLIQSIPVR